MSTKYELKNLSTGKTSQLDAISGTLGPDVINISNLTKDQGVFTFDPGFMATASTESKITYIDGDAGVLLYRGYPVEQLAQNSSFLEVAALLINGSLPTKTELDAFQDSIMRHTMVNEQLLRFFQGFHHDAHPMAMVSAVVASMAAFYHDTTHIGDPRHREIFAHRIIAKLPTIAAAAYKHTLGQPFIYPRNDLRYCANMLNMFFAVPCEPYDIDPVAAEALDLLFILHAGDPRTAARTRRCSTCSTASDRWRTSTSFWRG
jgi:citrate synthase